MPPAELLAANDHLAICEACYRRFNKEDRLEAAYEFARAELGANDSAQLDHLDYEQIAAYVDNTMSPAEAEILESHIGLCRQCDMEVSDLRDLKATLHSDRARSQRPPATFRDKFSALRRVPASRAVFQVAGQIILAALFVWIATIPLRTRVADMQAQLAELRQENQQLRQAHDNSETAIAELKAELARYQPSHVATLPDSPEQIILALDDGGHQVTLNGQGELEGLNSLPETYRQMVKTALTAQRVPSSPIIARLAGKSRNLMGEQGSEASFALLSPVATVTQSDRPTFRWTALGGASGYIVTIYKPNSKEVSTSQLLNATEWRAPQSLKPGGIYAWQVRALKGGEEIRMPSPAAPEAKFKILERAKAEELERAKQTYANSHLMLGILYAQAGLLDDAEREFEALSAANPNSRVAENLLRSVKAMRRR